MSADVVRVERRGRAAIVTLARPERMNALSRESLHALGAIGRALEGDAEVSVIVLTAEGDKAFCSGADLKERKGMDENAVREQLNLYRSELGWLGRSRAASVAAINGLALGGGLELAMLCDLRVAAEHALLGLPETGLGIIPGAGGTQLLPRLVGAAKAKEMILLGVRLDARAALAAGLVNRVSPAPRPVLEDTLEWLRPIIEGAPLAQRSALRAIRAALDVPLDAGLELERALYDDCLRSADRREALEAFAEKRAPKFSGR